MKILGLWSGHDASYCIIENGNIIEHVEWERHIREKEPSGDSLDIFLSLNGDIDSIDAVATCHHGEKVLSSPLWKMFEERKISLSVCGHHQAHAANAYYSSNFENAAILTIDGGGVESSDGLTAAASIWYGSESSMRQIALVPDSRLNIGGVWTRVTRYVFRYESGWPQGHQAGTVMALSALGDPQRYYSDVYSWFNENHRAVLQTPLGHVKGMSAKDPMSPRHSFLQKYEDIAARSDQDKYDLAASLQLVTEKYIEDLVSHALSLCPNTKNLCLSGGVALNSVAMGKLWKLFPQLERIYIPPVPYDGGLCIGAAQYHWHHTLNNPKNVWTDNCTPYLGISYGESIVRNAVDSAVSSSDDLTVRNDITLQDIVDILDNGEIVSVYFGRAESGRRALGNRSILADPRNPQMKDRVNHKVKHRQWFRPFAPSVMREHVSEWFEKDIDSPYMGFVIPFKKHALDKVPAVVHFDGSARLQTVTEKDSPWYHGFLTKWYEKTGIPIILNTSFNDREPICESPEHAIKCFSGTDIDHLYFPEHRILVSKNFNADRSL